VGTVDPQRELRPFLPAGCGNLFAGLWVVVTHLRLLVRGVELLVLAIREFFLPQFATRLFTGLRPVVLIDHPLDDRIPFQPEYVQLYLSFIQVWIQGLGALYTRFGNEAIGDIERSIRHLCRLYITAGKVYKRCQTTTARRRGPLLSPHFLLIRLSDPHLHCIPSLHVLILCYNYMELRRVLWRRVGRADDPIAAAAYVAALHVIRSTLLVKQHSLSDIGPSLFALSELFPDYDEGQVEDFVGNLFGGMHGIPSQTAAGLREAVLADYRSLKPAIPGGGAQASIEERLLEYIRRWEPRPRELSAPSRSRFTG
jgi:hypothetical protein